jgi:hypothetical protein
LTTDSASERNPLLGSWHMVHWEIAYSDDRAPTLPFGERPVGLIVYSTDGHMSACIARRERPNLAGASARAAPESERVAAFDSYFHYAGRYQVRGVPGGQHVVHEVTHSLYPNFVGTTQVRDMQFSANGQLTLSAQESTPGSPLQRTHRLVWARGG